MKNIRVYIKKGGSHTSAENLELAARAWSRDTGTALPADMTVRREGKPIFCHAPHICFSVSHSGSYWLAAFASFPVGADIQEHRPCNMELISRRFHEKEQLWLAEHGEAEDFFRIWTAKESYVKLLGTGIDRSFGSFSVIQKDGMAHEVCGAGLLPIAAEEGYTAFVCYDAVFEGELLLSFFSEDAGVFQQR